MTQPHYHAHRSLPPFHYGSPLELHSHVGELTGAAALSRRDNKASSRSRIHFVRSTSRRARGSSPVSGHMERIQRYLEALEWVSEPLPPLTDRTMSLLHTIVTLGALSWLVPLAAIDSTTKLTTSLPQAFLSRVADLSEAERGTD